MLPTMKRERVNSCVLGHGRVRPSRNHILKSREADAASIATHPPDPTTLDRRVDQSTDRDMHAPSKPCSAITPYLLSLGLLGLGLAIPVLARLALKGDRQRQ